MKHLLFEQVLFEVQRHSEAYLCEGTRSQFQEVFFAIGHTILYQSSVLKLRNRLKKRTRKASSRPVVS